MPHDSLSPAFTVAQAKRLGLTRTMRDSRAFDRPFYGLRAIAERDETAAADDHPAEAQRRAITLRAGQFAAYMHDLEAFSHSTAAVLWGLALPPLGSLDLHVSVPAPHRAPAGSGVRGHQLAPARVAVVRHPELELSLTDPATTWALLGAEIRHPYDLVAAADSAVRVHCLPARRERIVRPALTTLEALRFAVVRGRRGAVALREALDRVRPGSASRMETWMRLTVIDAGLPEPELDHDVRGADGRFIGCVDGAYPWAKVALEYEGDHHRTDAAQWYRDIRKHDDLVRAGWRVIRITRTELLQHPGALVGRIAEALRVARS